MFDWFLTIALKTSLLIAAAGIASAALAGKPAATRHLLWVCALVLALLMPLATVLVPSYAVVPGFWAAPQHVGAAASGVPGGQFGGVSVFAEAAGNLERLANAGWPAILAVWLGGALLFLLRNLAGHAGLVRWIRRAHPLRSPHWTRTLEHLPGERRFASSNPRT